MIYGRLIAILTWSNIWTNAIVWLLSASEWIEIIFFLPLLVRAMIKLFVKDWKGKNKTCSHRIWLMVRERDWQYPQRSALCCLLVPATQPPSPRHRVCTLGALRSVLCSGRCWISCPDSADVNHGCSGLSVLCAKIGIANIQNPADKLLLYGSPLNLESALVRKGT